MTKVMQGVRVLELASWTFVPAAGGVLADWGADVIKIEQPGAGDPQRGLVTSSLMAGSADGVNYLIEQPNRNKRSVTLDMKAPGGRELLLKMAENCDVFLTNWLEPMRVKFGVDVDDIRAVNPNIIYVKGSSHGPKGPEADRGSFDGAAVWARAGVGAAISPPGTYPINQPAGFNDLSGGQTIAGGIASALFHRERTGEATVVDVSLLGLGMWLMASEIVASRAYGIETPMFRGDRRDFPNPAANKYRTKDGRYVQLVLMQADRFWADFCQVAGRPELATDPRFVDNEARYENRQVCHDELDALFAEHDLAYWRTKLAPMKGVWAPFQTAHEVAEDPQALANGYAVEVTKGELKFPLISNPVQFDERVPELTAAPEVGQHTEEVLLELGLTWEDIAAYQDKGVV